MLRYKEIYDWFLYLLRELTYLMENEEASHCFQIIYGG